MAKNIVAAGLADKCEIQLSYAIGVAQPTSVMVDTFGTGKVSDEKLVDIVRENFDLRPAGIIKMLDLRRPIYRQTAAYGHFGRNDLDLPWEVRPYCNISKIYKKTIVDKKAVIHAAFCNSSGKSIAPLPVCDKMEETEKEKEMRIPTWHLHIYTSTRNTVC